MSPFALGVRPTRRHLALMDATMLSRPTVMSGEEIEALMAEPLGELSEVRHRVLWQDGSSMAGLLRVGAGQCLGAHTHARHHHHMWIIDGHASILGRELGPGSYTHVPSGVVHDIDAMATEGCTVFYLYLKYGD